MESRVFLDSFTLAWEQRKFDEVFDCTIPNNTLSRAELNYESGSVRNIHYGDILIKYGSVVDVQNDEIPFATGKSSDDFKGALLQDGDIIIADTAEDETTGKACEIGNSQGLDVVSGLHTMVCRPRDKMALGYLGYYLNSDAYHHQLLPLMQGIKVLSLSRTNVQKTMVCYPKSNAEQQLIADCFRNLDKLITLHQCKESAFSEWKDSGFLQKHKTTWEQRKLESLVIDHNAGVYIRKEDYGSGTNVIGVGNIYDNDIFDGEIYRLGPVNDDKFLLEENDLIYGESSLVPEGIARTVCVGKNGAGSAFAWHTRRVKLDQNIVDSHFATLELNYNVSIRKYLMSVSTQTALTGMTTEGYFGATLVLPSVKEQAVISEFFKNLDHLITLHQRKPFCINRRQKWKQTTKMQNYSANIMQNGFQYIRKGR